MSIKINLNIFLLLILFLLTSQLEIYALVMLFALIHELGHLMCGVLLGFEAESLRIMPLGFVVEFKTNINDYNKVILPVIINNYYKIGNIEIKQLVFVTNCSNNLKYQI